MDSKAHWEAIYRTKTPQEVSWFQPEARASLDLIRRVAPALTASILDVGGGASRLVDGLLEAGYSNVHVLDLSGAALSHSRLRLGATAARVPWIEADLLTADLPRATFDIWHDRALFHFLTAPADRARYVAQVRHAVRSGGHVVVGTFAEDGPTRCSGLPVVRYTPEALADEFGPDFRLIDSLRDEHRTPSGARQAFVFCVFRVKPRP